MKYSILRTLPLLYAAVLGLLPAWVQAQAVTCFNGISANNPDSIYTVHGDGTVTDSRTGLMWAQCVEGLSGTDCSTGSATGVDWPTALSTAASANLASYTDWRLPNLKELRRLVEECRTSPSINDAVFPATPTSLVWSSSPYAGNVAQAWSVDFASGGAFVHTRSSNRYIRLVRAGQSFDPLPALSAVAQSGVSTATSADVSGTSNLAATGYWVVVASGATAPTSAQVKAGIDILPALKDGDSYGAYYRRYA